MIEFYHELNDRLALHVCEHRLPDSCGTSANRMRGFSAYAREVEEIARHCRASSNKSRGRGATQEIRTRLRFDCYRFAQVRWFKDRGQPLTVRSLPSFDQIVVRDLGF